MRGYASRRAIAVAGTTVVLGVMTACAVASEAPFPRTTETADLEAASPETTTSSTGDCPDLEATVPPDLRRVDRLVETDMPAPQTVRIVFEDSSGHRSAVLMSSSTTELRGHGYPGTPQPTRVGGRPGTVNERDGRAFIRWSVQDSIACPHWTVIVIGLTDAETSEILATVQVDSRRPA